MAIAAAQMNAKDAIKLAFQYFHDFFDEASPQHVLLEGVSFEEDTNSWIVSIGFEIEKTRRGSAMLPFGQVARETRRFHLEDESGNLLSVDSAQP